MDETEQRYQPYMDARSKVEKTKYPCLTENDFWERTSLMHL